MNLQSTKTEWSVFTKPDFVIYSHEKGLRLHTLTVNLVNIASIMTYNRSAMQKVWCCQGWSWFHVADTQVTPLYSAHFPKNSDYDTLIQ